MSFALLPVETKARCRMNELWVTRCEWYNRVHLYCYRAEVPSRRLSPCGEPLTQAEGPQKHLVVSF